MRDDKDPELTVLDSQFGPSDSETEFDNRGLPDKKPEKKFKISSILIFTAIITITFFLIDLFVNPREPSDLDKHIALENKFFDELSNNNWSQAQTTLSQLPLDSTLQSINTWLKTALTIDDYCRKRNWSMALQTKFPVVKNLNNKNRKNFNQVLQDKSKNFSSHIRDEWNVKNAWLKCSRDSLTDMRKLLSSTSEKSVYYIEIRETLDAKIEEKRAFYIGQFQKSIIDEKWDKGSKILIDWSELIPEDDLSVHQKVLNENKKAYDLYQSCLKAIYSGQIFKAISKISSSVYSGDYTDRLNKMKQAILDLEGDSISFNEIFKNLELAEWSEAFNTLNTLRSSKKNLVLDMIKEHWLKIKTLDEQLTKRDLNYLEEKINALSDCQSLLDLLPTKKIEYKNRILQQKSDLSADLGSYVDELVSQSEALWEVKKFPQAFRLLKKILLIQSDHSWASAKTLEIEKVAETLLSEIYITKNFDLESAQRRLKELEKLLPEDHYLIQKGRQIIDNK